MAVTGWQYGKRTMVVKRTLHEVVWTGRSYKALEVVMPDGNMYVAFRLYNGRGHFIKQFLMEPRAAFLMVQALASEWGA